jgi:CRP/FNR family transcriptional regulator, polysaccharide utilization system transcription regulator
MQEKILLIEDNEDVRENTAELLELSNYKVITAANGKLGIEKAKKESPNLIICDIMMPELDGYEVLYILGKDTQTAAIPFIFLTAKAEKTDFRKGMNLGADDYITKPFDEMELLNTIESRLKKSALLKKEFSNSETGLNELITTAKGIGALDQLVNACKIVKAKKKEILFREGDIPSKVFLLIDGKVKTYKINDDGKEYITGLYAKGDYFGYLPVLQETSYDDWAMTMEDSEFIAIPKHDFFSLIYNNREVSAKFIKMLSKNISEKEEQLISLAYDTVRKRVADALMLLVKKYKDQSQNNFKISFPREALSQLAGTAKETTIRALSDLKSEGLIDLQGSNIIILNETGLKKITY